MNTPPNPPVTAPRRIAVYRLGDEPKSLVAKLTLMLETEAADQIQIESESQEFISTVREILKRTGNDGSNDTSDLALLNERRVREWTRLSNFAKSMVTTSYQKT
jgi:hypothetical protein